MNGEDAAPLWLYVGVGEEEEREDVIGEGSQEQEMQEEGLPATEDMDVAVEDVGEGDAATPPEVMIADFVRQVNELQEYHSQELLNLEETKMRLEKDKRNLSEGRLELKR